MTTDVNRRRFLKVSGWGALAAGGVAAGWFGAGLVEYMGASSDTPWKTLSPDEVATLDRLAEELIPADPPSPETGGVAIPGAHDAKVVRFLDWQLAPGAPYERHRDTYREHVEKVRDLPAAEVEKKFPQFFKLLLTHVKQGFYGHPRHGGNAGWASYRMLGLAGPSVTGRNVPGQENHL